jgi:hypothetical protein
MESVNANLFNSVVVLILVFGTGVIIAVSISWLEHRTRTKALEVLRIYAQRGEEPPASVVQALTSVGGGKDRFGRPAARPTRAGHLAHVAANITFAAGFAGIVWWLLPESGKPGTGVIVAALAGLFFAAGAAARLVAAIHTPRHEE